MKSVMRYVSQLSKTLWDGQQLVSGIGCQPETAFDEFLSTKLLHHKDGGVMFYHMTLRSKGPFHRHGDKIKSDHLHQQWKVVE